MYYYYNFNHRMYSVFIDSDWVNEVIKTGITVKKELNLLYKKEDGDYIEKCYLTRMYRDDKGNAVISFKNQTVNVVTDWLWWSLEDLLEQQRAGVHVGDNKFIQSIYKRGLDKVIVHVPDRDENDTDIPCYFVENQYKLLDGYKLEVKSINPYQTKMNRIFSSVLGTDSTKSYYERSFYQSDFFSNMKRGYIRLELL